MFYTLLCLYIVWRNSSIRLSPSHILGPHYFSQVLSGFLLGLTNFNLPLISLILNSLNEVGRKVNELKFLLFESIALLNAALRIKGPLSGV